MFIKTVSTTSGINPIKFDETGGVFYWILNTGLSTIYASTKSTFTAGDDGVVSLGPKESRRLETNNDTIYILGAGQVEIHNQRDGICSFKQAPTSSGSGGGGTIDAYSKTESDAKYAQKTDIPSSLPANGGNADTVGGKTADEFMPYIGYVDDLGAVNQNCICSWNINTLNTPFKAGKTNAAAGICIVNNVNGLWPTYFVICSGVKQCFIHYKNPNNGEFVGNWKEISTTPIKSTAFSGTTDNNSICPLWGPSENKIPIAVMLIDMLATIFYSSQNMYEFTVQQPDTHLYKPNIQVSGTVYYIEI